jgi:hypothetical protein
MSRARRLGPTSGDKYLGSSSCRRSSTFIILVVGAPGAAWPEEAPVGCYRLAGGLLASSSRISGEWRRGTATARDNDRRRGRACETRHGGVLARAKSHKSIASLRRAARTKNGGECAGIFVSTPSHPPSSSPRPISSLGLAGTHADRRCRRHRCRNHSSSAAPQPRSPAVQPTP